MDINFKLESETTPILMIPQTFELHKGLKYWSFVAQKHLSILKVKYVYDSFVAYCVGNNDVDFLDEKEYNFLFVKNNDKIPAKEYKNLRFLDVLHINHDDIYVFEVLEK